MSLDKLLKYSVIFIQHAQGPVDYYLDNNTNLISVLSLFKVSRSQMSQMFALPKDAYFSIKTKDRHLGLSKKCLNLILH